MGITYSCNLTRPNRFGLGALRHLLKFSLLRRAFERTRGFVVPHSARSGSVRHRHENNPRPFFGSLELKVELLEFNRLALWFGDR